MGSNEFEEKYDAFEEDTEPVVNGKEARSDIPSATVDGRSNLQPELSDLGSNTTYDEN